MAHCYYNPIVDLSDSAGNDCLSPETRHTGSDQLIFRGLVALAEIDSQRLACSRPKMVISPTNSAERQCPLVPVTKLRRRHVGITRDTKPPMYLTRTGIRSKSFIKATDGISQRQDL